MISKPEDNRILTGFLLDYSENRLSATELSAFKELLDSSADLKREADHAKGVSSMLKSLPKVKAGKNFDRKMAARFALELEREVIEKNSRRIGKTGIATV